MKRDALHVGEDTSSLHALERVLGSEQIGVCRARGVAEALKLLREREFDLVFAEAVLPQQGAKQLVSALNEGYPDVPLVLLSDPEPGAPESDDFVFKNVLQKPVQPSELSSLVQRLLATSEVARVSPPPAPFTGRLAALESNAMREVDQLVRRAARGDATVMIRGESGTGKEVVARTIHELSPRATGPFVKVHCAAIPESILESELFGYEKGAFTGATVRKPGRVELSQGGTLFLDEIGDVPLSVQVKLLRVIQDREYERLGGVRTLKADVRFVCATHRNLEQMVKTKAFREDLYYRLNVVRVMLPALRNRRADVERLAHFFCESTCRQNRKQVTLEDSAIAVLTDAPWPGNVRQLQNFLERVIVLSEASSIDGAHIRREFESDAAFGAPDETTHESSAMNLDAAVRKAERRVLERALRKTEGNRLLAARILGVSRRTLFYKLREHGLT